MTSNEVPVLVKPLLRGHLHQAAFFFALGACAMLIAAGTTSEEILSATIYSLSQAGLFGISALYHRPQWSPGPRLWMRRLDHAAIFISIAGTCTPICMVAIPEAGGYRLLAIVWTAAALGIVQSLFWVKAPKWLAALLYVGMGWMAVPYMPEIQKTLGTQSVVLLLTGGVIYTLGALVYALKRPNPSPTYFGYHEIFHLMVIGGAVLHFLVIAQLIGI